MQKKPKSNHFLVCFSFFSLMIKILQILIKASFNRNQFLNVKSFIKSFENEPKLLITLWCCFIKVSIHVSLRILCSILRRMLGMLAFLKSLNIWFNFVGLDLMPGEWEGEGKKSPTGSLSSDAPSSSPGKYTSDIKFILRRPKLFTRKIQLRY